MGNVNLNNVTNIGINDFETQYMNSADIRRVSNRYCALFKFANITLCVSCALLFICIVVSYPLSHLFSMPLQVASHLMIIISASVLKVAYVLRCIAQYEQHKQVL